MPEGTGTSGLWHALTVDGFAVGPVSLVHTCRRLFMHGLAVLFGKRSRPERLRRVPRSPAWSRVLVAVQSCLMGGGLKSHGEWV